jgi:hypothetical protein
VSGGNVEPRLLAEVLAGPTLEGAERAATR